MVARGRVDSSLTQYSRTALNFFSYSTDDIGASVITNRIDTVALLTARHQNEYEFIALTLPGHANTVR